MDTQNLMGQETSPAVTPTPDERTMAILSHVLSFVGGFIAPLIIYLIKKDESAYVREHAKESLNFQITMFILIIGLLITIIGALLIWPLVIVSWVFVILATIKASENKMYKYPINFRFIK